jgi:hypothetical protein
MPNRRTPTTSGDYDRLCNRRSDKTPTVLDEYTRKALAVAIYTGTAACRFLSMVPVRRLLGVKSTARIA